MVDQGAHPRDWMHDEKSRNVGVPELAPKNMEANAAELCIDIPGDFPVGIPQRGAKADGQPLPRVL